MKDICDRLDQYTAVFCVSDLYAVTLMAALVDAGKRVPEDISVIGFDDNMLAKLRRPGLTTVHQETEKKGIIATETLIAMLNGESVPEQIILQTELVIRDTVRDIRADSEA